MSAHSPTKDGAATAAPKPNVAKASRFSEARRLAGELERAQTLGLVAADVWQAASNGTVRRDAWRSMLALACDLTHLAAAVDPDDSRAECIAAVADDLQAAVFGDDVTPTGEHRARAA